MDNMDLDLDLDSLSTPTRVMAKWTEKEEEYLLNLCKSENTINKISELLKRSENSIGLRLGLLVEKNMDKDKKDLDTILDEYNIDIKHYNKYKAKKEKNDVKKEIQDQKKNAGKEKLEKVEYTNGLSNMVIFEKILDSQNKMNELLEKIINNQHKIYKKLK